MAAITAKTLREKTDGELKDQLILEKKKLFDGIVKSSSGESIKAHDKREGKRLIARIETILSERAVRKALDAKIADLTPKAAKAAPAFNRLLKSVEDRAAAIKTELAKEAKSRKVKPQLRSIRTRQFAQDDLNGNGGANRSAVRLAEAKRVRHGLEREDMGQKA
ncbi:MAG: 50S ribosomal protein L29 [Planctomycetota bacterium]